MTANDFLNTYYGYIADSALGIGLDPMIALSQAFIESSDANGNFGQNPNALNGNNYFGIGGDTTPRTYNTVEDSIDDYFNLLSTDSRYADVLTASGTAAQADALQNAGYAANANYSKLVQSVIPRVQKLVTQLKLDQPESAKGSAATATATAAANSGSDFVKQVQDAANKVVNNAAAQAKTVEKAGVSDVTNILTGVGIFIGVLGLGYTLYTHKKHKR